MMIFTHFLRRLFPCCAFCLLAGGALQGAKAQTLFNYEMQKSIERQRNARFGIAAQRIAFFQQNALMYLWHKMSQKESRLPLFYQKLDRQANFLAEFLTVYHRLIINNSQLTEAQQERWKRYFTESSLLHPLFNDPNDSVTLQFLDKEERSPTPFSLDTDWETAYQAIMQHAAQEGVGALVQLGK